MVKASLRFLENLNVDGWMGQHQFKDVPSIALLTFFFYLIYILPYSKASNWPPKLIMQLIPQNLLVSWQVWTLGKVQWAAVPSPLHPPSPPPWCPLLIREARYLPQGRDLALQHPVLVVMLVNQQKLHSVVVIDQFFCFLLVHTRTSTTKLQNSGIPFCCWWSHVFESSVQSHGVQWS